MKNATIQMEALACPSCLLKIEQGVKSLAGVAKDTVKVMFNSSKVKLNYDGEAVSIEDIEKAITALGYVVIKSKVKDI